MEAQLAADFGIRTEKGCYYAPVGPQEARLKTTKFAEKKITLIDVRVPNYVPCFSIRTQRMYDDIFGIEVQIGVLEFDKRFWIEVEAKKDQATQIARAFFDEEGRELVSQIGNVRPVGRDGRYLRVERRGWVATEPEKMIDTAKALAKLVTYVDDKIRQTFEDATSLGLTLCTDSDTPRLYGTVGRLNVTVDLVGVPGDTSGKYWYTHIQVDASGPQGLRILHKDFDSDTESIDVHNPFLRPLVCISGDHETDIVRLFDAQEFVDAMLPIVHGNKGSSITESGVQLQLPGTFHPNLTEWIQTALTAARYVDEAGRSLPKEPMGGEEVRATVFEVPRIRGDS